MKSEAEVRGRIQALEKVFAGQVGPVTVDHKRTTRLMIGQLLWALDDEEEMTGIKEDEVGRKRY